MPGQSTYFPLAPRTAWAETVAAKKRVVAMAENFTVPVLAV